MKRVVSGISVPIVILGSSINTETGVDKKIGLLLIEEIITLRYSTVQTLLVLQKFHPKVCNHGEGSY